MNSRIFILIVVALSALASAAQACVGCREPGSDTIAQEPGTVLAGFGFSWGVLLMLGCVLGLLGGLIAYICHTVASLERGQRGV